ncbi:U-box domain-containing protein 25 [Abeliophyllum distichum]|uniref:U-box domain-containing protein 25 n=1 Tax=Abeliophyllum distichum TaxID=126358 RepID=A0ABD1U3T2_9LAMI
MPMSLEPLDMGVQVPYHFRCPISLELMRDPVTICTALIEIVVVGLRYVDLQAQNSNAHEIFKDIVGILTFSLAYPRALKIGIKALFALCLVKQHWHKEVEAGAVEALINHLAEFKKCESERALASIELLCRILSGCMAFVAHSLTIPLLVKIILKIFDRVTEYAAGALFNSPIITNQEGGELVFSNFFEMNS